MELEYEYWQDGDGFIGFLKAYPLYGTQGKTLVELEEMLADLYHDLKNDVTPVAAEVKSGKFMVARET